jgi:hypothetical protein
LPHAEPVNEEQALAEAYAPSELGFPLHLMPGEERG